MREILFRGKGTHGLKNGEWVYGFYVKDFWGEERKGFGIIPIDGGYSEVDPETVGQYTGLTDKNGKKIFEGDIIQSFQQRKKEYVFSVIKYGAFRPDMFYKMFEMSFGRQPNEDIIGPYVEFLSPTREQGLITNASSLIEVIGNIHDNPELLEVKE